MTNTIAKAAASCGGACHEYAEATSQTLEPVFSSSLVVNGPTTSRDGRLFLAAQPAKPGTTPQVVEVRDGKAVAYPDERWNGWRAGHGRP